ncbi:MAG: radical SAM protein [Caldilineaceae bacterium]|nr:radical SAM protein [Caldilineaceae bacterium]
MQKKLVIELTNRCNLHCDHCFSGRHGGRDDLPLAVLEHLLSEARAHGFEVLNFTGGDPTVYRHFMTAIAQTCAAGYDFTLNTNGWNFLQVGPQLLPYRQHLQVITFSLDGATAATHDQLRGKGSYQRVLQAISLCVVQEIPFTVNMVVTAHNRHEVATMAHLMHRLGSRGLRFGHLMPSPLTTDQGLDLTPWERKLVEAEIQHLRRQSPLPIVMAPGHYTTDLFPCAPLHLEEVNIDCHGNLTTCCHLSGHGDEVGRGDIMGNLQEISFTNAYTKLQAENERFRQQKLAQLRQGQFQDTDFFTCWHCSNHYGKVDWLQARPTHAWTPLLWTNARGADAQ